MENLTLLIEKLKQESVSGYSESVIKSVLKEVAVYFQENLKVNSDEVAILLADKNKEVLSFAYPEYLVNSGIIPLNYAEAIVCDIFRNGKAIIENNFNRTDHFYLFEFVKNPEKEVKPIWKIMGTLIKAGEDKIGVIEISRKGSSADQAGADFHQGNLDFLNNSIASLAPFIKKVLPENFRGVLT